jgi:hypothetical protein
LVDDSRLASLQAASCTYRIALGPHAGLKYPACTPRCGWRATSARNSNGFAAPSPALNAKLRAAMIPQAAQKDSAPAHEHTHGQAAPMRWAPLLKRVFHIVVERCACGCQLKILAAIEEPVVIVRILTRLGLPARVPPRTAAREFLLDYAA